MINCKSITSVLLISLILTSCNYYKDYNDVKKGFKAIEGVELLEVEVGNHDVIAEEISARIRTMEGIEIGFKSSLTAKSFVSADFLSIEEFENWEFLEFICSNDSPLQPYWWKGSIDVSHNPQLVNNIPEAISNVGEIRKFINKIPEYPNYIQIDSSSNYKRYISKYKKKDFKSIDVSILSKDCEELSKNSSLNN